VSAPAPTSPAQLGRHSPSVPRLALTVTEAAEALGTSLDFFAKHVAPDLHVVRRGRKKLISITELQRWLDENAEQVPR
jgi:excisionase family DNA binding protein